MLGMEITQGQFVGYLILLGILLGIVLAYMIRLRLRTRMYSRLRAEDTKTKRELRTELVAVEKNVEFKDAQIAELQSQLALVEEQLGVQREVTEAVQRDRNRALAEMKQALDRALTGGEPERVNGISLVSRVEQQKDGRFGWKVLNAETGRVVAVGTGRPDTASECAELAMLFPFPVEMPSDEPF